MTIEIPLECEDWVKWIVDSFDSLEQSFPHRSFLDVDDDWPDWVKAIARELISTLYPAGKFKVSPHFTPDELGAFMGQRIAYFNRLCEPNPWPGFDGESHWLKMTVEERRKAKRWLKSFEQHAVKLYEVTAAGLALALVQSHSEATAFMTAFARGLAMKPADMFASNFQRTTTRIYWLLLCGWPSVPKLGSVRKLHEALCRFFEPAVVGDQKRIEKLCQRIGLSFGEPGRPPKRKNKPT